jgi:phosphoribosylaminoimidazolecarboxamide formyltransferase/IMP cyclohydrolase
MSTTKTIQSALISVFSQEGLEPIVEQTVKMLHFILLGGTEDFIKT